MKTRPSVPLNAERARDLFIYDPNTGRLLSKVKRGKLKVGAPVGTVRPDGRRQLRVDWVLYLEHHVIWLIQHGEWPTEQIDHKDLVRSNNAADNLRRCENGPNNANRRVRPDSLTGIKGVRFDPRRLHWVAYITKDWKRIHLGSFHTPEAASEAYRQAAVRLHGEFARHE